MANNFVIFYNGREGSTAIVNSLSGQSGVRVPLMEDLDAYDFLKHAKEEDLPETLNRIFKTGVYKNAANNNPQLQTSLNSSTVEAIGFKWRIFGNSPKISQVLIDHNVIVFVLFRRSFLDIVSSGYVHDNKDTVEAGHSMNPHPQFDLLEQSQAEQEQYLETLNAQNFKFIRQAFLNSALKQLNYRKHQIKAIRRMRKLGVTFKTLFYEDYNDSPEKFIMSIVRDLGVTAQAEFNPECSFTKVHKTPVSERIVGLDKFTTGLSGYPYRKMKREYDSILSSVARMGQDS